MTLEEVKAYFGTSYRFSMITGFAHTNFSNWEKKKYIPYLTQKRLEEFTDGVLKADWNDGEGKVEDVDKA
jgi:hypothetical protein